MSFGRRLILFFLLIVVLPMLAVGGLLLQVTAESRTGKADARLAAGLDTALALADEQIASAQQAAARLAPDPGLTAALRSNDPTAERHAAERLAEPAGITAVVLETPEGTESAHAGDPGAIEFARVDLQEPVSGRTIGSLAVSTTTAEAFAERVAELSGRDAVVLRDGAALAGTAEISAGDAPAPGSTKDMSSGGEERRARTVALTDDDLLVLLGPTEGGGPKIDVGVALLLALLFAAAVAFAFLLARTLHSLHELTSQRAVTDELTGLSNQRRFRELLGKEIGRAKRFDHDLSLLILDLDDFKSVNDNHGHLQGDDVLRQVATAVRDEVREVDEPARYGGEEFAVALPETDAAGAAELAERVRARIEAADVPLRSGAGRVGVTVSIGVAGLGGDVEDSDDLIATADEALYAAKAEGKNRVHWAGTAKSPPHRRRGDRKRTAKGK